MENVKGINECVFGGQVTRYKTTEKGCTFSLQVPSGNFSTYVQLGCFKDAPTLNQGDFVIVKCRASSFKGQDGKYVNNFTCFGSDVTVLGNELGTTTPDEVPPEEEDSIPF